MFNLFISIYSEGADFSVRPPKELVGYIDGSIHIPCRPKRDEFVVRWLHNGRPILADNPASRHVILSTGALEISNLGRNDVGKYSCELSFGGNRSVAETRLKVDNGITEYSGPTFQPTPPTLVHAVAGSDALLTCHGRDRAPDTGKTKISRFSGLQAVPLKPSKNAQIIGEGNLRLKNVTAEDDGIYLCQVQNSVSSARAQIRLKVQRKSEYLFSEGRVYSRVRLQNPDNFVKKLLHFNFNFLNEKFSYKYTIHSVAVSVRARLDVKGQLLK